MKKLILLALFSMGMALAEDNTPARTDADMTAHKAKIEQAIKDRNYDAWKAEHESWRGNTAISEKITKDNFEKFAQMVEARQKGDVTTAQKLREELGIQGQGKGGGKGMGQGKGKGKGQGNCSMSADEKGQKMGQGKGQGKGKGGGKGMKNNQ